MAKTKQHHRSLGDDGPAKIMPIKTSTRDRELADRAARKLGVTRSQFVRDSFVARAKRVLR